MKRILCTLLLVVTLPTWAQKAKFSLAETKAVRVYFNGAEISQKAQATLPVGTSTVVFSNISNYVNDNTIQIGVPNYTTVLSMQYTNQYLEEYDSSAESPLVKPVKDSITLLQGQLKKIQNQLATEQQAIDLLDRNKGITSNFSVAELQKLLQYYKTQRVELQSNVDALNKKQEIASSKLEQLKTRLQINQPDGSEKSRGKIILTVENKTAGLIPFEISYLSQSAYWNPYYDLNVENINAPIQMLYKAQITQNTGIDWKNVALSLSSGTPNESNQAPELNPKFIYYREIEDYNRVQYQLEGSTPGVNVMKAKAASNSVAMNDQVVSSESQMSSNFDISMPFTVLSNNKKHSVLLKNFSIPATYQYFVVPKLNTNVYLMANIKNYNDYNILDGEANIMVDGVYVGKTYITANASEEDLKLSLGKDAKIAVNRTLVADKSSNKVISNKRVRVFTYDLTIKNNKNLKADILVEDQVPLSQDKDIEVSLIDRDGADYNAETGKLSWKLNLKPNETKKIRISYSVKHDKNKEVEF